MSKRIHIHFKAVSGPVQHGVWIFTEEEYVKFQEDFLSYIETGEPKTGVYLCHYDMTLYAPQRQEITMAWETVSHMTAVVNE